MWEAQFVSSKTHVGAIHKLYDALEVDLRTFEMGLLTLNIGERTLSDKLSFVTAPSNELLLTFYRHLLLARVLPQKLP